MRWSNAFIPTLRDDPADAEAVSHKLLVRGGFIRQLMAGSYSLLPLGQRVARRVEAIIRQEMEEIGAVIEVVGRAQKGKDLWYEIKKNGRGANETKSVPLSEIETMYMP